MNDESKRIDNAELVEVAVDSSTRLWTPIKRIRPTLPEDPRVILTPETVSFVERTFNGADEWL